MTGTGAAPVDDEYAALYREHNARLVAYARSLTGSAAVAEDLAAEAHFRVWRRISAGHTVDNPSAYLTTTVRNLAAALGRAQREIARDVAELPEDPERAETVAADPERRASQVDLISRLLKELPERWAKALWYAEVEDLPMEAVGRRIGASAGTTAVVLTRARERLRQAFLLSQPGVPANEECEQYWKQMPTLVRATASARRTRNVLEHCEGCEDCRARMLALTEANTRLPLLLGPALFGIVLGGGAWFLPTVAGAGAGAAAGAAGKAGVTAGKAGGAAGATGKAGVAAGKAGVATRVGSRLARHGLSPTKATVYGSVAAAGIAVAVATIALGSTPPSHTTAATQAQATTAHPTATANRAAAASDPTSVASAAPTTAAAAVPTTAPGTTSPTSAVAAAVAASSTVDDAASPARQTPAAASTSPATIPTAAATTTTSTASTSSPVAAPIVVDSSPDAISTTAATATPTPTLTPTLTPTPTPSLPASSPSPSQSPTSGPTSGPTPPPYCQFEFFGYCVIW